MNHQKCILVFILLIAGLYPWQTIFMPLTTFVPKEADMAKVGIANLHWRTEDLKKLENLVQRRLFYLQNPRDCDQAKKVLCQFNQYVGFGSQMQDGIACLIVAYATRRTLILESDSWDYSKRGLTSMFQPLSTNCTTIKPEKRTNILKTYDLSNIENRTIVQLPRNNQILKRPKYMPLSIPEDLADRLTRVHDNPSGWWIGQILSYLTRKNNNLTDFMKKTVQSLEFKHPIVGIHVRRTDKKSESRYFALKTYMDQVEKWFNNYEQTNGAVQRRLFIATDEPDVIHNARKRYSNYIILTNINASIMANNLKSRYTETSARGIILDIEILSMCDFVVCTLTSSMGKLAYLLMNVRYRDAPSRIKSLDVNFTFNNMFRRSLKQMKKVVDVNLLKIFPVKENISMISLDNENLPVKMPTYEDVPGL